MNFRPFQRRFDGRERPVRHRPSLVGRPQAVQPQHRQHLRSLRSGMSMSGDRALCAERASGILRRQLDGLPGYPTRQSGKGRLRPVIHQRSRRSVIAHYRRLRTKNATLTLCHHAPQSQTSSSVSCRGRTPLRSSRYLTLALYIGTGQVSPSCEYLRVTSVFVEPC